MINRELSPILRERMFQGKALIVFGARQTGKTTLVKMLLEGADRKVLIFNGDEPDVRELLSNISPTSLKSLIGNNEVVVIDEAQRVSDIGETIMLIVDNLPEVQVIATGSSSFELSGIIKEPLTEEKFEHILLPFSYSEMCYHQGEIEANRLLEHRLIYGYYPEILAKPGQEKELLSLLSDSYLYKDLILLQQIKKPQLLEKIAKALAFQIGNEVSYNKIAQLVMADKQTAEKYIDLLEKAFIIFRLHALNRNMRNEIKRGMKVYFYNNGIRNNLIGNFNAAHTRSDMGHLWENFIISERRKYLKNKMIYANSYFWRTIQGQEIDYVEEMDGNFSAYEIKWSKSKKIRPVKTFMESYGVKEISLINPDSFQMFLQ